MRRSELESPERIESQSPVATVLQHLHGLVRKEIELVKVEVSHRLNRVAVAVGMLAVAAILALVGLNVLAGAATAFLVTLGMTPGLAALVVAGVVIVIALILLWRGIHILKTTSLSPADATRALERDAAVLKETLHGR